MKRTLLFASALALSTACKPKAAVTETKSLDNFARESGASVVQNSCGINMTVERYAALVEKDKRKLERIEAPTDELKRQAAGALAAVPKSLQSMFFASKGRILVVADADKHCRDAELSAAERKFASESDGGYKGCWQVRNRRLEIVLDADSEAIHHAMVRTFTYAYTQFFVDRLSQIDIPAEISQEAQTGIDRLKRQREALASAFLADVAARKLKSAASLKRFAGEDRGSFENFTLAEAVDSYYCSAATRQRFERDFPQTHVAFTRGPLALSTDFGSPYHE